MIIRESKPALGQAPREAHIGIWLQALSIPWLQEKGALTIQDDVILADGEVVATIERDPKRPRQR